MKKKILGGIAVLVIAAVTVFNVGLGSKTNAMSNVSLANVEALADSEVVVVPCCYEKDSTCKFNMIGQDGSTGTATLADAKNC